MSCCAPPRPRRRFAWIAPALGLAIIPKCPACLAAYIAYFGVTLSISTAGVLRISIIVLAIIAIFVLRYRR